MYFYNLKSSKLQLAKRTSFTALFVYALCGCGSLSLHEDQLDTDDNASPVPSEQQQPSSLNPPTRSLDASANNGPVPASPKADAGSVGLSVDASDSKQPEGSKPSSGPLLPDASDINVPAPASPRADAGPGGLSVDASDSKQPEGSNSSDASVSGSTAATHIAVLNSDVIGAASAIAQSAGVNVLDVYKRSVRGFAFIGDEAAAAQVAADARVAYVEKNAEFRAIGIQEDPPWGLDHTDGKVDSRFVFPEAPGSGVNVYVMDTGIRATHDEFGTRASAIYDAFRDGQDGADCDGHGTHVAGTIAGTQFGVAKSASIAALRVLDCQGTGSTAGIIAAIDWLTGNHEAPAVVNMSLGGPLSRALNEALERSTQAGLTYVVAAGNDDGDDACRRSPASAPAAITVAAVDQTNTRAGFSNVGACVDIFAPGVDTLSAWWNADDAARTISGTSMAAPVVAGVVALHLAENPNLAPAEVAQLLAETSLVDEVQDPGANSPNRLLRFNPCRDDDRDGYGEFDSPNCGQQGRDCDDTDPKVFPGAPESCNGRDDSCSGSVDDNIDPLVQPVADRCPTLGVCSNGRAKNVCVAGEWSCEFPPEYVEEECAVVNASCGTGSMSDPTCFDGVNSDCDGDTDEHSLISLCAQHPDWHLVTSGTQCWSSSKGRCGRNGGTYQCEQLADGCGVSIDCVDATFPEAERCDALDWDCDGETSDRNDIDGDGSGDCATKLDCDESDPNVHPGAIDIANGMDDDCDGLVDEDSDQFLEHDVPRNMLDFIGSSGGGGYALSCNSLGSNYYAVGVAPRSGRLVDGISTLFCAELSLSEAATESPTGWIRYGEYGSSVYPVQPSGRVGGTGGGAHTFLCPQDYFLGAVEGSVGRLKKGRSHVVAHLEFTCQRMRYSAGRYEVVSDFVSPRFGLGGSLPGANSLTCSDNELVKGFHGRAGSLLDSIGLTCGPYSIESR